MPIRTLAAAAFLTLTSVAAAPSAGAAVPSQALASVVPSVSMTAAASARCSATAAGRSCIGAIRVLSSRSAKDARGRRVHTVVSRQVNTLTTSTSVRTTTITRTTTQVARARPVTRKVASVRVVHVPAGRRAGTSATSSGSLNASAWELRVFQLTNAERVKAGLAPFRADACAFGTARAWSAGMRRTNRYEHSADWSPLRACGEAAGGWSGLAENIFMGTSGWQLTPEKAVAGWMASPGHRANILNRAYTRIGIGFAGSTSGNHYATQHFWG